MAKNFGQYDNDNPVMSVLAKAQKEQEIKNAEEILKSAAEDKNQKNVGSENSSQNKKSDDYQKKENQNSQEKNSENDENSSEIKKILMNISIRETTKKEWKMFFLSHDLTMTQGIETAVEFLKSEVEKGGIKLSKGGITRQEN